MDLEMILPNFAVFSGLTGDALQACPIAGTPCRSCLPASGRS